MWGLQLALPSSTMPARSPTRRRDSQTRTETFSSETALNSCKVAASKFLFFSHMLFFLTHAKYMYMYMYIFQP